MEGEFFPLTFGAIYQDFKGRRTGLIKALTTDFEEFFQQCDPEKPKLCLYGYSTGQWEVNFPFAQVPSDLPRPLQGINFARARMQEKDWISHIAIHCDSWLLAVSFYFAARLLFDAADRNRLFYMINFLPTVYEAVTKRWREIPNSSSDDDIPSSNVPKVTNEEKGKDGDKLCGVCGKFELDEFRIFCEFCESWFHAKCVETTPEKAEHIKKYKCRSCSKKKARPVKVKLVLSGKWDHV